MKTKKTRILIDKGYTQGSYKHNHIGKDAIPKEHPALRVESSNHNMLIASYKNHEKYK